MTRDNPYRPSGAPLARDDGTDFICRPAGLLGLSIAATFLLMCVAGLAPGVLRQFAELYKGFGAELPTFSRVALAGAWSWWLLALASAAITAWIARTPEAPRSTYRRMKIASILFVPIAGLMLAFFVFALYLPIFRLGAVV
jgi:type II secretory pathway component PulF